MWTYDFVLPGLVLEALHTGEVARLAEHLAGSPDRVFTTLDSHDGIPIRPDLDGVLERAEMVDLAERIERRGGNVNRLLSKTTRRTLTSTSSTAPTTRRSIATTIGMSRPGRSSCSPAACRRSTTPGSWPARTTRRRSSEPGMAARSTVMTTRRGGRGGAGAAGRPSTGRAHPAAQYPPGVRWRARRGDRRPDVASPPMAKRCRRRAPSTSTWRQGLSRSPRATASLPI